jgi:hypothetical protein
MEKTGMCPICYYTFNISSGELNRQTVMCFKCAKLGEQHNISTRLTPRPYHSLPRILPSDFYRLALRQTKEEIEKKLASKIKVGLYVEGLGYFSETSQYINPQVTIKGASNFAGDNEDQDINSQTIIRSSENISWWELNKFLETESSTINDQTIKEALNSISQKVLIGLLAKNILEDCKLRTVLLRKTAMEILQAAQEKIGKEFMLDAPNLALAATFLAESEQNEIVIIRNGNAAHLSSKKELNIETLHPDKLEVERKLDGGYGYQYTIGPTEGSENFIATASCRSEYDISKYAEHTILVFVCKQPEN